MIQNPKNQDLVDTLVAHREDYAEKQKRYSEFLIPIKAVELAEDGIHFENMQFSKDALKKMCNYFNIKDKFLSETPKRTSPEVYLNLIENIHSMGYGKSIFARKDFIKNEIDDVHNAWDDMNLNDMPNVGTLIDSVISSVKETEVTYELDRCQFDDTNTVFEISLLNMDDKINVLPNVTDDDIWKHGTAMTFDMFNVQIAPYYKRLVCENGMMESQELKTLKIENKNYNTDFITRTIGKKIIRPNAIEIQRKLKEYSDRANNNNISVLEYMTVRDLINAERPDDFFAQVLHDKFDIDYLLGAYRVDVNNMSKKWKSTADTNKKVYDVVNDITWLASHPADYGFEEDLKLQTKFKILASTLMFKKVFNLQDFAPKVEFKERRN